MKLFAVPQPSVDTTLRAAIQGVGHTFQRAPMAITAKAKKDWRPCATGVFAINTSVEKGLMQDKQMHKITKVQSALSECLLIIFQCTRAPIRDAKSVHKCL